MKDFFEELFVKLCSIILAIIIIILIVAIGWVLNYGWVFIMLHFMKG